MINPLVLKDLAVKALRQSLSSFCPYVPFS